MQILVKYKFLPISDFVLWVVILFLISIAAYSDPIEIAKIEPAIQFFPANNKNIRYTGRIDFTDSLKPKFWTPGVYIEAKFIGSSCEIIINDEFKYGTHLNYLEIVVDGTIQKRVQTKGASNTIKVAENLPDGEHTLLICKNTETNIGYLEFAGLLCKGLVALPPKPERKIEFIGNSITCGAGCDLSQVKCGMGKWQDQHNAYMAYGPITARSCNAQWHLSSYSGIGLIHSCCGMAFTMPEVFDRINLTPGQPMWDFSRYVPDVVTICLGQNDGILDSSIFCQAYINFIVKIRSYYPNVQIICLTSPMGNAELTAVLKRYLSAVVSEVNRLGDKKVTKFFFSRSFNNGCDNHPDLKEHQLIAGELEPFIKATMGW
jgi:hypothetical protein